MRTLAKVVPIICLVTLLIPLFAVPAAAGPKDAPGKDSTATITPPAKETLVVNWPKEGKWKAGIATTQENMTVEYYFPEGQSAQDWTEMGSVEFYPGLKDVNLMGRARFIFLGTKEACPDAEWVILNRGTNDQGQPSIAFRISCPKFLTDQSPEVQIWEIILGQTGLFTLQYSFRGKDLPVPKREQMLTVFKAAHLKAEKGE